MLFKNTGSFSVAKTLMEFEWSDQNCARDELAVCTGRYCPEDGSVVLSVPLGVCRANSVVDYDSLQAWVADKQSILQDALHRPVSKVIASLPLGVNFDDPLPARYGHRVLDQTRVGGKVEMFIVWLNLWLCVVDGEPMTIYGIKVGGAMWSNGYAALKWTRALQLETGIPADQAKKVLNTSVVHGQVCQALRVQVLSELTVHGTDDWPF